MSAVHKNVKINPEEVLNKLGLKPHRMDVLL